MVNLMDTGLATSRSASTPTEIINQLAIRHSANALDSSRFQPDNMEGELYALNRLRIGPSSIQCQKGAGQGLFITNRNCKPHQAMFAQAEAILRNITGITAFRVRDEKSKKYLEWLYYDGFCLPLTDDSHVLWSGFTIGNIEIGVIPDGPAMFINDSANPNCDIQAAVTQEFVNMGTTETIGQMTEQTSLLDVPDNKTATLSHFSHTLQAISFEVLAGETLFPGTELLWCYNPKQDQKIHNKGNGSSTNFRGDHLKKEHSDIDYQAIKTHMKHAFNKALCFIITNDFSVIQARRYAHENIRIKTQLTYAPNERRYERLLQSKTNWDKASILKIAEKDKDPAALSAYIKYRINSTRNISEALNNTRTIFKKRYCIPIPHKRHLKDDSRFKWGFYDFYRYCYDNDFLCLEDDILSVSFLWLGKALRENQDTYRLLAILRQRLRLALLANDNIPAFAENLQRYIPNPLREFEKDWTLEEIERFAGINRVTQHIVTPETVTVYKKGVKPSPTFTKSARKLYEAARKGDLDAQKYIVEKRLSKKSELTSLVTDLKKSNVRLLVDGAYKTADKGTLIKFIEKHFNRTMQKKLLGYNAYTNSQLLKKLNNKKNWQLQSM